MTIFICVMVFCKVIGIVNADIICQPPEQIHLSFGKSNNEMIVMWATPVNVKSWVTYRESGQQEENSANSTIAELTEDSSLAYRYIHRVLLKSLKQGTLYQYEVTAECPQMQMTSDWYNFTTISSNNTAPVSVLVYGDMGVSQNLSAHVDKLVQEIQVLKHQAVWHIGDFAYNLHSNGGEVGDQFIREIQPVSAIVPYMTAPGNHEIHQDFHHYRTRFSQPNTEWPIPLDSMVYSYDIGPIHFISYSTEVYFTKDQNYVKKQFYWLLKDLVIANRNRHIRPWIVAMGHRPLYCSNTDSDDCTDRWFSGWIRHGLEDLFYAQGVDLILQGHEHSYERTFPMYKDKPVSNNYTNPRAPVYIISGAAGCSEGSDPEAIVTKSWSAVIDRLLPREDSYGRLHVYNHSHLLWQEIGFDSESVVDSVWIVQKSHGPFDTNVDCDEFGGGRHSSCQCPFVFHFQTCQIAAPIVLILTFAISIVGIVKCLHRRRKRNQVTDKVEYLLNDNLDSEVDSD